MAGILVLLPAAVCQGALAVTAGPHSWLDASNPSVQLSAAATGGSGEYTYTWSPGEGLSATNIAGPVASPTRTTSYTVVVTDSLGETGEAYVRVAVQPAVWAPPIGIPAPAFGVNESHRMYLGRTYDFGSGPEPYKDAGNGPYTHYVDNTNPVATDVFVIAGKPVTNYGTFEKPRKTIPYILAAGSVVEVHGGPYALPVPTYFRVPGAADRPIFLRGAGAVPPQISTDLEILRTPLAGEQQNGYAIVENLDIHKIKITAPSDYVTVRNCQLHGNTTTGGVLVDSYNSLYHNSHTVLYNNVIHDNGDWLGMVDQDVHGIKVAQRTGNVWILDNEIYHNSGDGIQIDAQSLALMPETHHIYVGRNHSHHNKQSGMWIKRATDVIFSQNWVHDHRPIGPNPSAYGAGMGFQYGPERVWFLYNHVHDCSYGISSGASSGLGNGVYCYFIGNLLHDIRHDPTVDYLLNDPARTYYPYNERTPAGIALVSTVQRYIIGNTIYNADTGITCNEGQSNGTAYDVAHHYIYNNIIANINPPLAGDIAGMHIQIDGDERPEAAQVAEMDYNLLYQEAGPIQIRWGGTGLNNVCDLPLLQSRYGKGLHCLVGAPGFVDASGGNFHLAAASPAIKAGPLNSVYQTFKDLYGIDINVDMDGDPRSWHGPADMGADETLFRVRNANRGIWYDRIQAALGAVRPGETILVYPGIHRESLRYPYGADGGFDFALRGTDPADWQTVAATVVDGSGPGNQPVISLTGDERAGAVIEGLTIRGGTRGGIRASGNGPTIRRCIVADNSCAYGFGAGIAGTAGLISQCVIMNNSARCGGGLDVGGTISNCRIVNNTAVVDGGGISDLSGLLEGSLLFLNRCGGRGGAVAWARGPIRGCTIAENVAVTGGAVHFWWDRAVNFEVSQCIFWGNTAGVGSQLASEGKIQVSVGSSTVQGGEAGIFATGLAGIHLDPATTSVADPLLPMGLAGSWTAAMGYDARTDQTVLIDAGASFVPGGLVGRLVYVTAGGWQRVFLVAGNAADRMTVWGDATGAVTYRVLEYSLPTTSAAAPTARR